MTDQTVSAAPEPQSDTLTSASFVTLARIVGYFVALTAGLALGLGSYNDIVSSDGPANFILPVFIALAVAGGLGAGWHVAFGMAAQANAPQAKAITFAIGIGLAVAGASTSAWFLASKIGGAPAIQTHQQKYLNELQEAETVVATNAALENELLQYAESSAGKLEGDAQGEGLHGIFSGKSGFKGIYRQIKSAADGAQKAVESIRKLDATRTLKMATARRATETAAKAMTERDTAGFEKNVSRAAGLLGEANRIRFSSIAGGLSLGTASGSAGRAIESTARSIAEKSVEIEARREPVIIPAYAPMDAKTAVVTYPQPLPWIMALMIEFIPLLMLSLLLALPRESEARG